mmetsp:Transcript_51883/g.123602  ORF Transcript_51883/g.123602 Transcript_51883/m.123602 type:complete len:210 (+) Transcript_51883:138-767(+)
MQGCHPPDRRPTLRISSCTTRSRTRSAGRPWRGTGSICSSARRTPPRLPCTGNSSWRDAQRATRVTPRALSRSSRASKSYASSQRGMKSASFTMRKSRTTIATPARRNLAATHLAKALRERGARRPIAPGAPSSAPATPSGHGRPPPRLGGRSARGVRAARRNQRAPAAPPSRGARSVLVMRGGARSRDCRRLSGGLLSWTTSLRGRAP